METAILLAATATLAWVALGLLVARSLGLVSREAAGKVQQPEVLKSPAVDRRVESDEPIRVLIVDDDPHLRELVRTTFEMADVDVDEAESAAAAAQSIARRRPDVLVLDVAMPRVDGVTFCRSLKADPRTREVPVVLLTGNADAHVAASQAGADAFLRKPFSPLELFDVVERCAARTEITSMPVTVAAGGGNKQLLLYAHDLRRVLELERGQRRLLQAAYRETVVALAHALEAKDGGTGAHSERVRRYATELASALEPSLLREPGVEYGFILHDVGKIAIPDSVLRKSGALTPGERRMLEMHPVLGEQMVGNAALLRGHGAEVVRSHHERWDGRGYPDGLAGERIPLAARVFAVADALDAITSDRPYRAAATWEDAVEEIARHAGTQFDPAVVGAFRDHETALRRVYYEVASTEPRDAASIQSPTS